MYHRRKAHFQDTHSNDPRELLHFLHGDEEGVFVLVTNLMQPTATHDEDLTLVGDTLIMH